MPPANYTAADPRAAIIAETKSLRATHYYQPEDLRELPTIHQGQCCDCKIDTGSVRVWLCRVAGGVTIENYLGGRWVTVAGDCTDSGE